MFSFFFIILCYLIFFNLNLIFKKFSLIKFLTKITSIKNIFLIINNTENEMLQKNINKKL